MAELNIDDVRKQLTELNESMDNVVDNVTDAATKSQQAIYEAILAQINKFEITDGRFVTTQNYAARLGVIQRKINEILGGDYKESIGEYLAQYYDIDTTNTRLHRGYNELIIDKATYTPIRRAIYDQAEYYLTDGLADAYIQPAKYLLMQAVSSGMTIKDAERMLNNWNEGHYSTGALLSSNRPTPRLQTYATQLSRDSIFTYQRTIQDNIKDKYGLKNFIYVGGLVKDSRTFCRELVGLRRKINIDEVPKLIEKAAKIDGHTWPNGMIPQTNKKNFIIRAGGFSCRHSVMVVR